MCHFESFLLIFTLLLPSGELSLIKSSTESLFHKPVYLDLVSFALEEQPKADSVGAVVLSIHSFQPTPLSDM